MKTLLSSLLLILSLTSSFADESADFEKWKGEFAKRAVAQGLPLVFVKAQLKEVKYDPAIIEKDRNQITSDGNVNYQEWIQRWLSNGPDRIARGKELLAQHAKILKEVEERYGVDKEAIVSLWGVETLYGKITGNHNIIHALSTLAYDQRRRTFFEKELVAALKIVHQGHISADKFLGSWAGAMGQCQFMPTSFLRLAVDYDGDGKKDIWNNHADLFASMANYLKTMGWQKGKEIGVLVKGADTKFDHNRLRTKEQYHGLGVRKLDGARLEGNWRRKVASIPHKNSPLILRGPNYQVIMRWNKSSLFAALNILLTESFAESTTL